MQFSGISDILYFMYSSREIMRQASFIFLRFAIERYIFYVYISVRIFFFYNTVSFNWHVPVPYVQLINNIDIVFRSTTDH